MLRSLRSTRRARRYPTRHPGALLDGAKSIVLTAHPEGCVLIYPESAWEPVRARVEGFPSFDPKASWWKRLLLGFEEHVVPDGSGRILLAPGAAPARQARARGDDGWTGPLLRALGLRRLVREAQPGARGRGDAAARHRGLFAVRPQVHEPVLAREAIEALAVRPEGIYVDGTFGRGGHSRLILARLGPRGRLIALDRDPHAAEAARAICRSAVSFFRMRSSPGSRWCPRRVHGMLFDLGVSSPQLEDPARGFSFRTTARSTCAWIRARRHERRSGSQTRRRTGNQGSDPRLWRRTVC